MKVVTEASEIHDLSIPRPMQWALTGPSKSIEMEISEEIAAATKL